MCVVLLYVNTTLMELFVELRANFTLTTNTETILYSLHSTRLTSQQLLALASAGVKVCLRSVPHQR